MFNSKLYSIIALLLFSSSIYSQDIGGNKVGVGNFVRRMYNSQPFEGVKILQTQEGVDYMISVVALKNDSSKTESIKSRIASIKAKAFVSQYLNGSNISNEVIVVTTEQRNKDSTITKSELKETLKETSIGFIEGGMELIINFESNDSKNIIYIYYTKIKN